MERRGEMRGGGVEGEEDWSEEEETTIAPQTGPAVEERHYITLAHPQGE